MPKCPHCGEEIYWVIIKGKVFAVPFSYKDVESEKAELLKYNTIKEIYCPKCFQRLRIYSFEDLIKFFENKEAGEKQKSEIHSKKNEETKFECECPRCKKTIRCWFIIKGKMGQKIPSQLRGYKPHEEFVACCGLGEAFDDWGNELMLWAEEFSIHCPWCSAELPLHTVSEVKKFLEICCEG